MPLSTFRLGTADGNLAAALSAIRENLGVTADFPEEVEADAKAAVASVILPEVEFLDLPFFTIDPAESLDLDQAMCLETSQHGTGYRVWYAIADVPAFVEPGGALDAETRRRGQTLYPPDGRIPLHPTVISEAAASLLPGEVRGAYVWEFGLDEDAEVVSTTLTRARIRSRQRFDYEEVQAAVDGGHASKSLNLLKEIGVKRATIEQQRGGASLGRPEQEVHEKDGHYELVRRRPLEAESWNAQISLLTGMAAAQFMLAGGVGILRTMPPPEPLAVDTFRRRAAALGTPWPEETRYGEYLRTLDPDSPRQLAIMHAAASLFRGAGYTAFDGQAPADTIQAAVAAPYAHTTAPLRRLVDRFTLVVCEALANGKPVPGWARSALAELPGLMAASDNLAGRLDHATISALEAAVLSSRVGDQFEATVLGVRNGGGDIQLDELAVTARCDGNMVAGEVIQATLVTADIATGTILFQRRS